MLSRSWREKKGSLVRIREPEKMKIFIARREAEQVKKDTAGKFCPNTYLTGRASSLLMMQLLGNKINQRREDWRGERYASSSNKQKKKFFYDERSLSSYTGAIVGAPLCRTPDYSSAGLVSLPLPSNRNELCCWRQKEMRSSGRTSFLWAGV